MPASSRSCRRTRRRWAGPSCAAACGRAGAGLAKRIRRASSTRRRAPPRWARCTAPPRSTDARLACKLQYPDMASAVEADLRQLKLAMSLYERYDRAITTDEIHTEIAERLREELDYRARGGAYAALSPHARRRAGGARARAAAGAVDGAAADHDLARRPAAPATGWQDDPPQAGATRIAASAVPRLVRAVLPLRRDPRRPASRQLPGARRMHGSTCSISAASASSRRSSSPASSTSIDALDRDDEALAIHAYESWGFRNLGREHDRRC